MALRKPSRGEASRSILCSRVAYHPRHAAYLPRVIDPKTRKSVYKKVDNLNLEELRKVASYLKLDDARNEEIDLYLDNWEEFGLHGTRNMRVVNLVSRSNGWGGEGLVRLPEKCFSDVEKEFHLSTSTRSKEIKKRKAEEQQAQSVQNKTEETTEPEHTPVKDQPENLIARSDVIDGPLPSLTSTQGIHTPPVRGNRTQEVVKVEDRETLLTIMNQIPVGAVLFKDEGLALFKWDK